MTTIDEYLVKLKELLGIDKTDTSKDVRLTFVLESIIQGILTYCNISSIPQALDRVVLMIAEDYYRGKYATEFEQAPATVTSVKRGMCKRTSVRLSRLSKLGPERILCRIIQRSSLRSES